MQKVKEKYAQKFGENGKLRNRLEEQTQMRDWIAWLNALIYVVQWQTA